MTVTYKGYMEDKKAFFEKHEYDYSVDTSSMELPEGKWSFRTLKESKCFINTIA